MGIGGRGGSGKATLAALVPGAQVVGTDEFWDGDRFDLERLLREVFDPLAGATGAVRVVGLGCAPTRRRATGHAGEIVVVEGVCALHRDVPRRLRRARLGRGAVRDPGLPRGVERGGEAARATWVERWMPMEDAYVERDDPVAHLVIDGS